MKSETKMLVKECESEFKTVNTVEMSLHEE